MPSLILWAKFTGTALAVRQGHAEARETGQSKRERERERALGSREGATRPGPQGQAPWRQLQSLFCVGKEYSKGQVSWCISASALLPANPPCIPGAAPR